MNPWVYPAKRLCGLLSVSRVTQRYLNIYRQSTPHYLQMLDEFIKRCINRSILRQIQGRHPANLLPVSQCNKLPLLGAKCSHGEYFTNFFHDWEK